MEARGAVQEEYQQTLVVAHNAINQGLVNTAIGLPPSYFRCFLQSNAAVTVLDFAPNGDKPPLATLERMNSTRPGPARPSRSFNVRAKLYSGRSLPERRPLLRV